MSAGAGWLEDEDERCRSLRSDFSGWLWKRRGTSLNQTFLNNPPEDNASLSSEAYWRVWIRQFLRWPVLVPVSISLLVPVSALVAGPVAAALVARRPGGLLDDCVHPVSRNLSHSENHFNRSNFTLTPKGGPHNVKDNKEHTECAYRWKQLIRILLKHHNAPFCVLFCPLHAFSQ